MKKVIIVLVLGFMFSSVSACEIDPTGLASQECPSVVQAPPLNEEPQGGTDEVVVKKTSHRVFKQVKPIYVWDVVHFGDRGEDVKTLQMYLNNKGASLKVDGIYGVLTLQAFKDIK